MTLRDHIEQELRRAGLASYANKTTVGEAMQTGEFPRAVERAALKWIKEQEQAHEQDRH